MMISPVLMLLAMAAFMRSVDGICYMKCRCDMDEFSRRRMLCDAGNITDLDPIIQADRNKLQEVTNMIILTFRYDHPR